MKSNVKRRKAHFARLLAVGIALALVPKPTEAAFVRSVEYIEIVIGDGGTIGSAFLTMGQTVANCVPFTSAMFTSAANTFGKTSTTVSLAAGSPPTVTAQRSVSGGIMTVGIYVVEFDPAEVKVQRGTFTLGNGTTTANAAIPAAVSSLSRAAVVTYSRNNVTSGNGFDDAMVEAKFNSTSQLGFQREGNLGVIDGQWYVLEALDTGGGNYAFVVDPRTFTFSTASGTTALGAPIPADASFVIGSYRSQETQNHPDVGAFRLYLDSCAATCTDITATSYLNSSLVSVTAYALTFPSGVRVQRGVFEGYDLGVDTQTDTLSPPLNPQSTMVWNGFSGSAGVMMADSGTSNYMPAAHQRVYQVDATTVRGDRAMTDDLAEGSWEAVEWEATLAVELATFEASGVDGAVELSWETASELDNLGFHLYRAPSPEGPFERLTSHPIPGLGSSAHGARYSYVDLDLDNGATYFYELEDIDLTGATSRHGPVSATPSESVAASEQGPELSVGDPSRASFRVLAQDATGMTVELTTPGFVATPRDEGEVRLELDGFVNDSQPGLPDVPVFRTWLDLPSRKVEIVAVEEEGVEIFSSLTPAAAPDQEVVATENGTVMLRPRRGSRARRPLDGTYPDALARILHQNRSKSSVGALLELAPVRFDPERGLIVSGTLTVKLAFSEGRRGRDRATSRTHRRRSRGDALSVLVVKEPGLYGVSYEQLFDTRGARSRRPVDARTIRLSYQDEPVPIRVEPPGDFRRGSVLYFYSPGAFVSNPYGSEARYRLEIASEGGMTMPARDVSPAGPDVSFLWASVEREEERFYQSALIDTDDPWLWDMLFAPVSKSYAFTVEGLAETTRSGQLEVTLQGMTDYRENPDHHLRLLVNGVLIDDVFFDGKRSETIERELPAGILREGDNELLLENVEDTGAKYSLVMLDRFSVRYPRRPESRAGAQGFRSEGGATTLAGVSDAVGVRLDGNGTSWLEGMEPTAAGLRLELEANARYVVVDRARVPAPGLAPAPATGLRDPRQRADHLVVGPRAFLPAAEPLAALRRDQGLLSRTVAIEDVFAEFGDGERRPSALREFLAYTQEAWTTPPRYVLLLGDGTYDYRDALGTGVENHVPPYIVRTSYLWAASDAAYATVSDEAEAPSLALGRLPAASFAEAQTMVAKILAYEALDVPSRRAVLVADNPDYGGNFTLDAEAIANGVLSSFEIEKIYLQNLGVADTRMAILDAFDRGARTMSYIGHGGIQLWADETLFDISSVAALHPQPEQPILLTMNCLNGFFHFPYSDSLAESLVKADGKGAIAAFSPSGMSLNGPAAVLHRLLLEALTETEGRKPRLGDAVLEAQNAYAETGLFPELVRIYNLFGDPALTLR